MSWALLIQDRTNFPESGWKGDKGGDQALYPEKRVLRWECRKNSTHNEVRVKKKVY